MSQPHHARDAVASAASEAGESLDALVEHVKPHLRGWRHLGMVPASVAAAPVLVGLAGGAGAWTSALVFWVTAVLLFATSAIYHRGRWSPRAAALLKRWDHANTFLIIAGTHTPFAVILLPESQMRTLLWVVWTG